MVFTMKYCGTLIYLGISINGGSPIAGWFIMENRIEINDLGVPLFGETSMSIDEILRITKLF